MANSISRRLASLETKHAARNPEPPRELTHASRIRAIKYMAVAVAYWLGDSALAPWDRLYAGIAAGNASSDRASAYRSSFRARFEQAAWQEAGNAATGVLHTSWLKAVEKVPSADLEALYDAFADLEELHPELLSQNGGYDPYYHVTMDGQVVGCKDGKSLAGGQLAAFGVEAGIAALKRQEIELASRGMRHA